MTIDERDELEWERSRCGTIRPGTLGYQKCLLERGHQDPHRSQDRVEWADEPLP